MDFPIIIIWVSPFLFYFYVFIYFLFLFLIYLFFFFFFFFYFFFFFLLFFLFFFFGGGGGGGIRSDFLIVFIFFEKYSLSKQNSPLFEIPRSLIRKTCPCKVYPLNPHFFIVKLGYAGVYLFFLFLLKT